MCPRHRHRQVSGRCPQTGDRVPKPSLLWRLDAHVYPCLEGTACSGPADVQPKAPVTTSRSLGRAQRVERVGPRDHHVHRGRVRDQYGPDVAGHVASLLRARPSPAPTPIDAQPARGLALLVLEQCNRQAAGPTVPATPSRG
jgi:hypothetical protein